MNKNEYRRALIMLRSLKGGISGYVRLERRTLMGTLQFTVNGVNPGGELQAVVLYQKNGDWAAVRAGALSEPRYGQAGLLWKFDPRNIEGRELEQYSLAAVIEIRSGICELLLCGNLNGAVEADWTRVREAACRLFSPVRISGMPIAPIDEAAASSEACGNDGPTGSEKAPDLLASSDAEDDGDLSEPALNSPQNKVWDPDTPSGQTTADAPLEKTAISSYETVPSDQSVLPAEEVCPPDELDIPADESYQPDELDTPAFDLYESAAREAVSASAGEEAVSAVSARTVAGELLELTDPSAPWPESIEQLRSLFFSLPPVQPFDDEDDYVFIEAPMDGDSGFGSVLIGLETDDGVPDSVCYAIPAAYTPEPPAGLEGYRWRGDRSSGYWVICEDLRPFD